MKSCTTSTHPGAWNREDSGGAPCGGERLVLVVEREEHKRNGHHRHDHDDREEHAESTPETHAIPLPGTRLRRYHCPGLQSRGHTGL